MFRCIICGRQFLSQTEADLCSPREEWATRYPHRVEEFVSAFGAVA